MRSEGKDTLGCVVYVSIFVVIFSLLSFNYAELTRKDNRAFMNAFREFERREPQVLFVGDSHALDAVCLGELGPKYAILSTGSDTIRHMLLKLDYATKKKDGIQYVIVPLEYHMLSEYRYINKSFSRDLLYSQNRELIKKLFEINSFGYCKALMGHWIPLSAGKSWEKYFLILLRRLEMAVSDAKESVQPGLSQDWDEVALAERIKQASARIRGQLQEPIVRAEMVDLLDTFISFCGAKHIGIVGIKYPLSREYIALSKKYDIARVEKIYRQRRERFMMLLDYRELFIGHPEYFKNADHLGGAGARVFTRVLKRDIEEGLFGKRKTRADRTELEGVERHGKRFNR